MRENQGKEALRIIWRQGKDQNFLPKVSYRNRFTSPFSGSRRKVFQYFIINALMSVVQLDGIQLG